MQGPGFQGIPATFTLHFDPVGQGRAVDSMALGDFPLISTGQRLAEPPSFFSLQVAWLLESIL